MVGPLLNFKPENRAGEEPSCPFWLKDFLRAKFFVPCSCSTLQFGRAVESHFFCVDCAQALCPQCLQGHIQHHILQIRRSSYQNVVRIEDAQHYLDTTAIQPYVINSSKVVFLRERPQSRFAHCSNPCSTCGRNLLPDSRFCSIACKYEWVMTGDTSFSLEPRLDVCCSPDSRTVLSKMRNSKHDRTSPVLRKKGKARKQEHKEQALPNALLECMERLPNLTEIMAPPSMPTRPSGCCMQSPHRRKGIPHRAPLV